jgi:hypothetical protein
MIEVVMQYLIPAASLILACWDQHRGALWLFIGAYFGVIGFLFNRADPSSLMYIGLIMLAPLVYSLAIICLVLACGEKWGNHGGAPKSS